MNTTGQINLIPMWGAPGAESLGPGVSLPASESPHIKRISQPARQMALSLLTTCSAPVQAPGRGGGGGPGGTCLPASQVSSHPAVGCSNLGEGKEAASVRLQPSPSGLIPAWTTCGAASEPRPSHPSTGETRARTLQEMSCKQNVVSALSSPTPARAQPVPVRSLLVDAGAS